MDDKIVDVHDIATILLHERLLTERRFRHARLREVNDGSKPLNYFQSYDILHDLEAVPPDEDHNSFFLLTDGEEKDTDPPIDVVDYLHHDFASTSKLSPKDVETIFWGCKHHDSGYILANAMQIVLDSLPMGTTLLLRTSQGHSTLCNSVSFGIALLTVFPITARYIYHSKPRLDMGPGNVEIGTFIVGMDDGDVRWLYLLFGNDNDNVPDPNKQVMLDLAAPMIGMRGLGGEIFVMERMEDYENRVLPNAAVEGNGITLVRRIVPGSSGDIRNLRQGLEAQRLADRVLRRLERIKKGEEKFCSYCGKDSPTQQCSACHLVHYCGNSCQKSAWKYHKKWCQAKTKVV